DLPGDFPLLRLLPDLRNHFLDQLLEVHVARPAFGPPDPGECQQIIDQVAHSLCGFQNRLQVFLTLVVQRTRCVLLQQFRVTDEMAQRRPQVMRHGIGKRLELLVGHYQLAGAQRELLVELADFSIALLALFELVLQLISCVEKIILNAASNSTEGGNDKRREHENQKVRDISDRNVEGVERFYEKIVEQCRGQQNGHHGRSGPGVPSDKTDDEDKKGQLYIAELVFLNHERDGGRDHHRNDCKSVAQDRRPDSLELAIPIRHARFLQQAPACRGRAVLGYSRFQACFERGRSW